MSSLILLAGCNGCTQHTFTYHTSSSCSHQFCYDAYDAHCRGTSAYSWTSRPCQKTKNHAEAFVLFAIHPLTAIESTFNSGNVNLLISDSKRIFAESSQAVKKSIAIRTNALDADLQLWKSIQAVIFALLLREVTLEGSTAQALCFQSHKRTQISGCVQVHPRKQRDIRGFNSSGSQLKNN